MQGRVDLGQYDPRIRVGETGLLRPDDQIGMATAQLRQRSHTQERLGSHGSGIGELPDRLGPLRPRFDRAMGRHSVIPSRRRLRRQIGQVQIGAASPERTDAGKHAIDVLPQGIPIVGVVRRILDPLIQPVPDGERPVLAG